MVGLLAVVALYSAAGQWQVVQPTVVLWLVVSSWRVVVPPEVDLHLVAAQPVDPGI
jgi:hypothetical protein